LRDCGASSKTRCCRGLKGKKELANRPLIREQALLGKSQRLYLPLCPVPRAAIAKEDFVKWDLSFLRPAGPLLRIDQSSDRSSRGRRDADGRRSPTLFRRGTGRMVGCCYIAVTAYQPTFRYTTLMFPQVLWEEVMHASLHEKDARCSGT
jgi:hypothetical protein